MKCEDLTGQRFGLLTVIKRDENIGKYATWLCKCDCGKETVVRTTSLKSGNTKSCGCQKHGNYKHGKRKTRLYVIWNGIKQRTTNPNCKEYKYYGGRGITICSEWNDSFECFLKWSLENGYKNDLSIDRINNDLGYEPSNCRWATTKEQSNNKSTNVVLEYKEKILTISQWSEETGISRSAIEHRLKRGWSIEDTLTKPVKGHK